MKGRKAIPNKMKELRGTDRPCRMRDEMDIEPISDFFTALPKNSPLKSKRAKQIFVTKANQLIAMRILTNFDLEQLSIYAYSMDEAYTAMEEISEKGKFMEVYDDNGRVLRYVENPYMRVLRDMVDLANKIGADFGLSPMSRQKLKAEKPKEKSPFDELKEMLG